MPLFQQCASRLERALPKEPDSSSPVYPRPRVSPSSRIQHSQVLPVREHSQAPCLQPLCGLIFATCWSEGIDLTHGLRLVLLLLLETNVVWRKTEVY